MTAKKLKYTIDDVKQMSQTEINDNWDDVSDTLRASGEIPPVDDSEEGEE